MRAKNYTQKEQSNFCCNIQGHVDTERKINFTLQLYREGARGARAPRKGASPTKKGLNCRPLWHFCKQKSPIPSQLPHVFGFWLRSDSGFGEKLRWRAYLRYVPIAVSSPKRRINGDFTRQAGVGGSGVANPAVGGKTPCLKSPRKIAPQFC